MSKRDIEHKELQGVLSKDITTKNPVLSPEHIQELHALFSLYADPRQRRADCRDLLQTAQTLGLDSKYELVFRLINDINDGTQGAALDFERFLKELTARLVPFVLFREAPSPRKAVKPTSGSSISRARESSTSTTSNTSASS